MEGRGEEGGEGGGEGEEIGRRKREEKVKRKAINTFLDRSKERKGKEREKVKV